jgi:hypothetical protein
LGIDTCVRQSLASRFGFCKFGVTLIVAMSMEEHLVAQVVVVAVSIKVIDFKNISIGEVQFAPAAFPLLLLQEFRFGLMQQWMSLEALTPVQQVPIVNALMIEAHPNIGGRVSAC